MRLALGEQGGIREQMTSCEEIGRQRGERRKPTRGRKRNQSTLLSETPKLETPVKSVKDAPPPPRFSIYLKTDTFEGAFWIIYSARHYESLSLSTPFDRILDPNAVLRLPSTLTTITANIDFRSVKGFFSLSRWSLLRVLTHPCIQYRPKCLICIQGVGSSFFDTHKRTVGS